MSDVERTPTYPILVRGIDDPGYLTVIDSHDDAESSLELWDVHGGELEAWDALGHKLTLELVDGRTGRGWLRISIDTTEPPRDEPFLAGIIHEYGVAFRLNIQRTVGESLQDYAARTDAAVAAKMWNGRPWWRRLLGLPNFTR